ncbi:hypothetical protein [Actinoplanes regularis]|uniref:Uncharacterized protein n=1 Tax=Actinoplanes regularis TaxID=52697 RepID=A0A239AJC4_9ACTN|nr:hypothetical protein [Actinoplanes regularis]GIE91858.1 hypothetical protein Are01nite_83380 [Actinoplanes regularis]SNR95124.1 hypothetical protein SAMN06264365_107355 [Actinoplanes regularis]
MSDEGDLRPVSQLAHRVAERPAGAAEPHLPVTQWFELHPVPVDRPAAGVTEAQVRCGTCGETVDCVVASVAGRNRERAAARWVRNLLRAIQVFGAGLGVAAVVYGAANGTAISGAGLIGLIAAVLTGGGLVIWAGETVTEVRPDLTSDGVRLASPSPVHEIRRPGDNYNYTFHTDSALGGE